MRQKRFLGPKEAFAWLQKNDPKTYKLLLRTLKNPSNLSLLKAAASSVYMIQLNKYKISLIVKFLFKLIHIYEIS